MRNFDNHPWNIEALRRARRFRWLKVGLAVLAMAVAAFILTTFTVAALWSYGVIE